MQNGSEVTPISSVAETANVTAPPAELEVEFVMLDGTVIVGGVVSVDSIIIVTTKLPVPVFPAASDAVQVTVVVPAGKLEPEDGEQVDQKLRLNHQMLWDKM